VNRTVTRAQELVVLVQAQQLPFLAAAIAYYAFLSVVPLLVVAMVAATAVAGETLAAELVASLDEFLTPEATELLESTLVDAPGRGGVTLVGVVLLLWGALRVFRGLDVAFSQVYGTTLQKSLPEQVTDALLVFGAVAAAIGATVLGSVVLSLSPVGLAGFGGSLGLLVVLPLVFFPLYYVFPAEDVTLREAVPGAVFAGAGWTALGTVFGIYASQAGSFELYGVLGGVLLLLVWFYFAGLLLLVGAALNAILAGRLEDRQLQHGGPRRSNRGTMGEQPAADHGGGDTDETDSTGGEDGPGDGRERLPDGGESDPDPDDDGPDGSAEPRYPGVQSLQLTRGDIPRHRGDRPNEVTEEDLDVLRERIDEFEAEIESRTVHREELERELKGYVRKRTRRGRARGWGPYLVLLYGTAMTLGAFFFLGGLLAILAMLVIWLSTLGLYALMVLIGITSSALELPGRISRGLSGLRNLR
jgi:membrane protein